MFKWFKREVKPIPKPSETEVLFDSASVFGFTVRPWTLSKCEAMSPIIAEIVASLKAKKLKFEDFFARNGEDIEVINIDQIVFTCIPYLSRVFSITLDKDRKEFENLSQEVMVKLAAVIVQQNMDFLKNLFALTAKVTALLKQGTI